jgi:predicted SnoaL-like aldol condensation-catalyzing enzyme
MGVEANKAIQRRIVEEVINGKELALADELFSADHRLHPATAGVGPGPDGMKEAFSGLHAELPDVRAEIEAIVAEGDLVAVRLAFRGTHAATGRATAWSEMVFTRFADGKAVESWEVVDAGTSPESAPG